MRIGNSGTGSHTHFSASALFATGGAKVIDVPFGEGQAVVNLLGSRIEGVVQLPAALVSHVKSGDLRVLAVLGSKRDPVFPDVPTANELGYAVALDMWRGIAVPKGTPKPIIAKLQDAIKRTVESQPFKDAGKAIGFMPAYLSADDFGKADRPRRCQARAAHDRSGPEEEVARCIARPRDVEPRERMLALIGDQGQRPAMRGRACRASPMRCVAAAAGRIVVAGMLAAAGAFFAWQASLLDLGDIALPGPGFFPLVLGAILMVLRRP